MTTTLDLNRRLAEALGWTNIVDVGNALLGMPPWGIPEARGQAKVPNWAGCWKDCGPLLGQYQAEANVTDKAVYAKCKPQFGMGVFQMPGRREVIADHLSVDFAARAAIVHAAIAKLEAAK